MFVNYSLLVYVRGMRLYVCGGVGLCSCDLCLRLFVYVGWLFPLVFCLVVIVLP